jgi:hypothetical protein
MNTGFLHIRNSRANVMRDIVFNGTVILPVVSPMFNYTEIRDSQMLNTNYPLKNTFLTFGGEGYGVYLENVSLLNSTAL